MPRLPMVSRYEGPWTEVADLETMNSGWMALGYVVFDGWVYSSTSLGSCLGKLVGIERRPDAEPILLYDIGQQFARPNYPTLLPVSDPPLPLPDAPLAPKPGRRPLWPDG